MKSLATLVSITHQCLGKQQPFMGKSLLRTIRVLCLLTAASSGTPVATSQVFLTNGLVCYYPFNGNANDAVGTNNGTVVGATLTTDRFGLTNHAYLFDGTAAYIQFPDTGLPGGNAPRTVSLWLKATSLGSPSPTVTYPFSYGADAPPNVTPSDAFYAILNGLNPNAPFIAVGKSGGGDTPQWNGLATNVWFQLAITYADSLAKIYINGHNVAQGPRSYGTTLTGNFYLGKYLADLPPAFYGAINDVRIYNRALSPDDLSQLYTFESGQLGIHTAVEVNFLALPGSTYQIQNSSNMIDWINVGSPIIGTNQAVQQLFSTLGADAKFYRVIPP
jgi:hypothetical protein